MAKRLNSRRKGNNYELKIAKRLAKEWGFPIVRTPNSGAFKGLAPADIIPEDRQIWCDWPFHLECKNREGWNLEQLLKSDQKCPVLEWYLEEEKKQVEAVGDKFYEKCMLLIFTKKYDTDYVMYRVSGIKGTFSPFIPKMKGNGFLFSDKVNRRDYIIVTLDTFLKSGTFEEHQNDFYLWQGKVK